MTEKQREVVKKFQRLGFSVMGTAANGKVFVELRSNEPIRAAISADGAVTPLSGDVAHFDWSRLK